jgi:hypothetical protein
MSQTKDFSPALWHDNAIHALRLELGNSDAGDWRSNLLLDIDHIVEWLCPPGGLAQLRMAPALLRFTHAGDLQIGIDCGDSAGQVALHEWSIDRIEREKLPAQRALLDRPQYRWNILLNWPHGGFIRFTASGYDLTLRGEAHLTTSSRLPPHLRALPSPPCV